KRSKLMQLGDQSWREYAIVVGFGESNLTLYNVAALSKINASTGCDAILGRDFLSKKLISIDFKNRKLNLKI
ncbi:hypothetical protein, partial [Pseudoalteromonas sp. APC 3694]|uniref:hypothetical protein n=2 Tax=unclassified Pseudoalteromonas TaxID=194690 RepID=UPI0025B29853